MERASKRALLKGIAALLGIFASGRALTQVRNIVIGANPAGTNFNLVAGGFAKTLQEALGIPSIVRPYSGSSVYVPLLQRGEIALGINSGIDSYLAYTGQVPYPIPMSNLRGLLGVYPLGYMYWARARSGLRRVEDLRGRRVVLDYRGLVVLDRLNRAILATAGLTDADVEPVTAAGLAEGARAVLEGRADAVAMGYRLPLVSQMHSSIPGGVRFLTMGREEHRVGEMMPGAWVGTVTPEESVAGIDAPIRSSFYQTYLNTGLHVDAGLAYDIVATIYGAWPELRGDYGVLAPVSAEGLLPADNPHPFHDGAIRFFDEIGLWTPEHAAQQRRLLAP